MKLKKIDHRQGDISFHSIDSIPEGKVQTTSHYIVALGETTGHKHELFGESPFDIITGLDESVYLSTRSELKLQHNKHDQIIIPSGVYRIHHEREWDYFDREIRKVID